MIATSSTVSAGRAGKHLINIKLGMPLEVATAAGSFLGGITAQFIPQSRCRKCSVSSRLASSLIMLTRAEAPERDPRSDTSIRDCLAAAVRRPVERRRRDLSGQTPAGGARRHHFVAGNVSSLLGIGGGIIKVPALNAWCGVPLRAAAATSAFMIGVTATAGAVIYYGHGQLEPTLGAAAVLGVQLGSWGGDAVRRRRVGEVAEGDDGHRARHPGGDDVRAGRAMTTLERTIGIVLRTGVILSTACLVVGLIAALVSGEAALSRVLLNTGIIILLATPFARVVVSVVQYTLARDWTFAVLTTVVLIELLASAVAALVFNRKL